MRAFALACVLAALAAPAPARTPLAPLEAEPGSARVAAMGGTALGLDSGEGWELDPSSLADAPAWSLRADEALLPADLQRQGLSGMLGLGSDGGWGWRLSHTSYGSLDGRDASGASTGSFEPRRLGLGLGYGWAVGNGFSLGSGLSAFDQSLGAGADVTGVLAGVAGGWSWAPAQRLSAGLQSATGSTLERVVVGGGGRLGGAWSYALQGTGEQGGQTWSVGAGLEGRVGAGALRLGWRQSLGDSADALSGFSAGAGFHWRNWSLDYAWLPLGGLGASQRLSVDWRPWTAPAEARPEDLTSANLTSAPPLPFPAPADAPPLPDSVTAAASASLSPTAQPTPAPSLLLEFKLPDSPVEEAYQAEDGGDVAGAKERYQDALKTDPKDTRAWMGLGRLYYKRGQRDYAIQCFEQVLRLNPAETKLKQWLDQLKSQGTKK